MASSGAHHVHMQRNSSFFMRGGSVVGAVLVVALLSAAAVMIDSSSIVVRDGLLAQSAAPSATPQSGVTAGEAKAVTGACKIGYDYVIKMEEGKPVIYVADSKESTKKAANESAGNRCTGGIPGAPNDGTGTQRWCQANTGTRDASKKDWHCKVRVCKMISSTGTVTTDGTAAQTQEKCFLAPDTMQVGKPLDAATNAKEAEVAAARQSVDMNLTPEERQSAEAFVSSGTLASSDDILGALNQERINTATGLELQESVAANAKIDYEAKLKEFETYCAARGGPISSFVDPYDCSGKQAELNSANQKVLDEQRRLVEYQRASQRLADLQGGISPAVSSQDNCDPGTSGCSKLPKPPSQSNGNYSGGGNTLGGNQPSPYLAFLGANSNQSDEYRRQLYAACQAGNGRACDEYLGQSRSGGVGAYGTAPNQGGCNTNSGVGGGGGILGTVISLVMRGIGGGNSGCNNGSDAPTPSCTITATPRTVAKGQAVTLSWQSERAFSASLSSSGSVAPSGSVTVNPQTTTTYTLQVNGYVENRTGQQLRGQCSTQVVVDGEGGGDGAPKAEISCRPEVADVGMSIAVSFACANSVASSGSGFSTNNAMSGSATPVIQEPSIGITTATYGLTCSKEGKTDSAQCTISINKPSMVLIANPKNVESGEQANIGWITGGMEECSISSPTLSDFTSENAGNTATSGVAKTPALTEDTEFELSCTTKSGLVKVAKTTVVVE